MAKDKDNQTQNDTAGRDSRASAGYVCKNTDKEIWRKLPGDFYSDSIHVTGNNGIGINCGGHVIVAPIRKWHDCGEKLLCVNPDLPRWKHKLAMWLLGWT